MFVKLLPLLAQCQGVRVLLSAEGDQVTVVVIPEAKEKGVVALALPFSLTGTAEEIDAVFFEKLEEFIVARKGLVDQIETTKTILEAARMESAAKAVKPASSANKSAKASGKTSSADVGDGELDGEDESPDDTEPTSADSGDKALDQPNLFV